MKSPRGIYNCDDTRSLFTSCHSELHHNPCSDWLRCFTVIARILQKAQLTLPPGFPPQAAPARQDGTAAKSALRSPGFPSFITWQKENNSRRIERTSALADFASWICWKASSLSPTCYGFEHLFQVALAFTQDVQGNAQSLLNCWWNILTFKQANTIHFLYGTEKCCEFLTRCNGIMSASAGEHSYFLWSCWETHRNRLQTRLQPTNRHLNR